MERRLAAILAADMVGYSRLMEADEEGTVARQKAHRAELIDLKIAEYHGRIVKTTGDGLLVEFASAVDAVRCAVEIQRALAEREVGVPEDHRIQYRVGINLGDIIIDGDDILGDGVNVAARMQEIAEPGGIYVSGTAYDQLKQTVEAGYEFLGERQVKNIKKPVRVYRVLLDPEAAGKVIGEGRRLGVAWQWPAAMAVVVSLLVIIGGVIAWQQPWRTKVEPASVENMPFPLPAEPSIVVLSFVNMSGDPEHDYIGDGLTENITAALSQIRQMFVISRTSAFTIRKKTVKAKQVAEDFSVRYVLEGSVHQTDETIRVIAQLIDAVKGDHVWSKTYDRDKDDILAIQDDITREIVVALQIKLVEGEAGRIWHTTKNLEAWKLATRGHRLILGWEKETNLQARALFQKSIELDGSYVFAWYGLGVSYWAETSQRWSGIEGVNRAKQIADKIIQENPKNAHGYGLKCLVNRAMKQFEKMLTTCEKGLEFDPNSAIMMGLLGMANLTVGRDAEAEDLYKRGMRHRPYYPNWYLWGLAWTLAWQGKYEEAIKAGNERLRREKKTSNLYDYAVGTIDLAAIHGLAGNTATARKMIKEALKARPDYTVQYHVHLRGFSQERSRRLTAILRELGLPNE